MSVLVSSSLSGVWAMGAQVVAKNHFHFCPKEASADLTTKLSVATFVNASQPEFSETRKTSGSWALHL